MNGIGGLGRPAEAEIISFLVCYLPFFARDIRVCFTNGINKFGFMVRRNIQGFLLWLQGRTRNGDGKIGLQHYTECCYDYAGWVWAGTGAGVKTTCIFCSFGDRIGILPAFSSLCFSRSIC